MSRKKSSWGKPASWDRGRRTSWGSTRKASWGKSASWNAKTSRGTVLVALLIIAGLVCWAYWPAETSTVVGNVAGWITAAAEQTSEWMRAMS